MITRVWDITFIVSDLEREVHFFEAVLGLTKKYHYVDNYAGFDCGGVEIGLAPGTPGCERDGAACVDFLVDDVDQAYQTLNERGVSFKKRPHDTPWGGRIAQFSDPDGNLLQLVQIDWQKYFSASAQS